jgi:glycerol-3-phosphate dehydrogenase
MGKNMSGSMFDIAVVGGGVNGCGIARDAAGRGLSVLLLERGDLAGGTSSASTKLIHGGLRYLEHYEFSLVRAALREREVLLSMAPHIVRPMRFVLPHHRGLRAQWLIRAGLFLYDRLGGRNILPASRKLDLRSSAIGAPLKASFKHAFEYSDCWVDDARLVVLNAKDAATRGADIRVRTEMIGATPAGDHWRVTLRDTTTGAEEVAPARVLVNAAGPWVSEVTAGLTSSSVTSARLRLVKGSHIVVPKLFEHDRAYIFQHADQRVVFAIPYERDFTLIGTTDIDYAGDAAEATISDEEVSYLCDAVSTYFADPIRPNDVVWSFSIVRPLHDDGEASAREVTRDYHLTLDAPEGGPAALNVFGGKITTYRHLAEEALAMLAHRLPTSGAAWTNGAHLPGGDFPVAEFEALAEKLATDYPALETALVRRLARAYGTQAYDVLGEVESIEDLGRDFGAGLYQREVEYLVREEWAMTAEDIVWRRSKCGLHMTPAQIAVLQTWLAANRSILAASAA